MTLAVPWGAGRGASPLRALFRLSLATVCFLISSIMNKLPKVRPRLDVVTIGYRDVLGAQSGQGGLRRTPGEKGASIESWLRTDFTAIRASGHVAPSLSWVVVLGCRVLALLPGERRPFMARTAHLIGLCRRSQTWSITGIALLAALASADWVAHCPCPLLVSESSDLV